MNFLTELKEATAELHQQTEQLLYASQIMQGTLSLMEYKHLLLTHFLFHAALENELERHDFATAGYDINARRKLPALKQDLQAMAITEPVVTCWFANWEFSRLLGACYVAEGSTLGGRVIEKHLRKSESLHSVHQFHFYGVYGEATGEKWKAFSQFLLEQGSPYASQVIQGASEAFRIFQSSARHTRQSLQTEPFSQK